MNRCALLFGLFVLTLLCAPHPTHANDVPVGDFDKPKGAKHGAPIEPVGFAVGGSKRRVTRFVAPAPHAHALALKSGVALVTNIAPNHLDWHRSLEHYAASKQAILTGSPACPAPRPVDASRCTWRADVLSELELAVPGSHNRDNAIDAIATIIEHLTLVDGEMADPRATASACAAALRDFPGLPHRLEFVGEHRGIRFFNDSKSTTPGATGLAVESMPSTRRTHLIAGGYDKGSDLEPVARLARDLAGLYGIGATEAAICEHGGEACGTLAKAFERAVASAGEGDVVLLSPGCASWDQFTDFEVRGRTFRELVERLD